LEVFQVLNGNQHRPRAVEILARYASQFIAKKSAPACHFLKFHQKQLGVALRSMSLIICAGQQLSPDKMEEFFENKYDEFGPLFDLVARIVSATSNETGGEAAQRVSKTASEALILVFPKGNFA
jgi:hypothetical protein